MSAPTNHVTELESMPCLIEINDFATYYQRRSINNTVSMCAMICMVIAVLAGFTILIGPNSLYIENTMSPVTFWQLYPAPIATVAVAGAMALSLISQKKWQSIHDFFNHNVDVYQQGQHLKHDEYLVEIVNDDTFLVAANEQELALALNSISAQADAHFKQQSQPDNSD